MQQEEKQRRQGARQENVHTHDRGEVSPMWSKLFGGDDGLPRAKVDAVVGIIDRYLAEEAELRGLQSDKQTIHPRDLPPERRKNLMDEVFAILADEDKA